VRIQHSPRVGAGAKAAARMLAAVGLTAALLAACVPASGFPSGTFHRAANQAPLTLVFSAAGTVSTYDSTHTATDTASFQVSENEIAIESDTTCPYTAGIYVWAFDGQTLRLTVVSDDCAQRKDTLSGSDWIREQPPEASPSPEA
jgi:hypothetical protein